MHNNDVIMSTMASQITSLTIIYSTVYSGADQRQLQSSESLAFVRRLHRWPVNSPHKGPVTRKMLPFDDVIMVTDFTGMAVMFVTAGCILCGKIWSICCQYFGESCAYLEQIDRVITGRTVLGTPFMRDKMCGNRNSLHSEFRLGSCTTDFLQNS